MPQPRMNITPKIAFVAAIVTAGLLTAPRPLAAQPLRVGFGIALDTQQSSPVPVFRVPINVASRLRIEPEFGYEREVDEATYSDDDGANPEHYRSRYTMSWVGAAVLLTHSFDRVKVHYGGRFGYSWQSERDTYSGYGEEDSSKYKLRGHFAGPVLAGEYFFSDRFSLGVDLMLRYTSVKSSRDGIDFAPVMKETQLHTETALTARIYVW